LSRGIDPSGATERSYERTLRSTPLPFRSAPRVELIINLRTDKASGRTIPPSILARADEVIE